MLNLKLVSILLILLMVGYFLNGKDFKTMDNEARLYIVGEGPLKKYLTKNSINNNVKFLGYVDKKILLELYLKSTCFIFPTLSEGSPSVLSEALSFGLPIIATFPSSLSLIILLRPAES